MNGSNGSATMRPISEMMTEITRRITLTRGAAAKAFAKHQPTGIQILDLDLAGDFFQPGGGFLDLDSLHAQVEEFPHGDGTAAIGHGDDDAMDFLFVDDFHQVRGHGVAGYGAFHLARPTGDLDADFRILAQALHQSLRALAGTQDVDALDQNGQLDEPGKTEPPSEKGEGQDEQAYRRRAAPIGSVFRMEGPQKEAGTDVAHDGQTKGHHARHQEQAEIELPFGVQTSRVVKVEASANTAIPARSVRGC